MSREQSHRIRHCLFTAVLFLGLVLGKAASADYTPDKSYLADRAALDEVQKDAFRYMWEDCDPISGMAYEVNVLPYDRPIATGGTGFGVAAIIVAADRGWITRNQAVDRLLQITGFLLEKTERANLHGAFSHWIDSNTGKSISFSSVDDGADLAETSFLVQGLLIARAYFNGPGVEAQLRDEITKIWEGVNWNWFTNGEENGLYWHWSPQHGFSSGLKILGYNECLITYLLAIASPTYGISRSAYDYWTSGTNYRTRTVSGYDIEATMEGGGPLFLAHYSFIGLNPRWIADEFVHQGYFIRNVKQTLANRAYCLQETPKEYQYASDFWGLTASKTQDDYAVSHSRQDNGTVAPTAALSSMPYTPYYSLQVLRNLRGDLRDRIWGKNGPFDAINLRDGWVSDSYLAIDQLPIVCMIENYRSGLLWKLFMSDPDVKKGLERAELLAPKLEAGFPEAVVTLGKDGDNYADLAYDIVRHPDTGKYSIPYWCDEEGAVTFTIAAHSGQILFEAQGMAKKGRNLFSFEQFMPPDGKILTLAMDGKNGKYVLPMRLY